MFGFSTYKLTRTHADRIKNRKSNTGLSPFSKKQEPRSKSKLIEVSPKIFATSAQSPLSSYDKKNTFFRFSSIVFPALGSAALIAIPVSSIEKGIIQKVYGTNTIKDSLASSMKDIKHSPLNYFLSPSTRAVFSVYAATYLGKNISQALFPGEKSIELCLTSLTFTTTSVIKDAFLGQLFNPQYTPPTELFFLQR